MDTSHVSRRHAFLNTARILVAATASVAVPAQARDKIAQKIVGYQDQPNVKSSCSGCRHFTVPNACDIVDGTISPDGWCKLFSPKS